MRSDCFLKSAEIFILILSCSCSLVFIFFIKLGKNIECMCIYFYFAPCASLWFCKPLRTRCCSNGCLTCDITMVTSFILFSSNVVTFNPHPALQSIVFQLPAAFHGDWSLLNTSVFRSVGWCSPAACTEGSRWSLIENSRPPNVPLVLLSNPQSLSFSKPTLALFGLFALQTLTEQFYFRPFHCDVFLWV